MIEWDEWDERELGVEAAEPRTGSNGEGRASRERGILGASRGRGTVEASRDGGRAVASGNVVEGGASRSGFVGGASRSGFVGARASRQGREPRGSGRRGGEPAGEEPAGASRRAGGLAGASRQGDGPAGASRRGGGPARASRQGREPAGTVFNLEKCGGDYPNICRGKVLPTLDIPCGRDRLNSSSVSDESQDDEETSDSSYAGDGDTVLTPRDLGEIRGFLNLSDKHKLSLPKVGDRCQEAPPGHFTVFSDYIRSGLTIPPPPLLVDIVRSLGVSFSQLTPNAINVFTGFHHRVTEFGLTASVDLFHALFSARRVMPDSYIYLQPRAECKFITSGPSNRGLWKERFFFVRDDGWNVPTQWSSETRKIHQTERHRELESQCERLGLFAEMFNPLDMLSESTKHSLAQVRSFKRKKVGGIPETRKDETSRAPGDNKRVGAGQGRKTLTGQDTGEATGPAKPTNGQVPSEENSGRRSTTVNGDRRANAEKSSGTRELSPKRAALIRIGGGRHFFVDGINNQEKAGSY